MNVEFLRKNGWMVGAVVVCLCALVAGVVSLVTGGARKTEPARRIRAPRPVPTAQQERAREILYAAKEASPEPTAREVRQGYVDKYRRQLEETPDAPETPVTLLALGMTYQQLQDFDNAAWAFDEIIRRFPDSNQCLQAWLALGTCYEFTGNQEKIISTYVEMAKAFPPDTDAHKFAQSKLKLLDIPMPGPVAEPAPVPEPGFVSDVEFESASAVAVEPAPAPEAAPAEETPAADEAAVAEEAPAEAVPVPAAEPVPAEVEAPAEEAPAPAQ